MGNPIGNELVQVIGIQNGGLAAETEYFTTKQIGDLGGGGGGGVTIQQFPLTGTTDTVSNVNTFVGWLSAAAGDKVETIPVSTGSLGLIIISDLFGNAATYPINVVPVSGNIIGPASIYTNFGSASFLDTSHGWCSV